MYFENAGMENTVHTLTLAYNRGRELGLNEVVLASSKGDTVYQALDIFKGFNIISVTYHGGFKVPFENVMQDAVLQDLEARQVRVIRATHALSGVERAIAGKYNGTCPVLLIADTLRLFGQGTKVAVEVAIMAADAGVLSGNDIIAIGGTARGADTALVITPANQSNFFDLRIKETVCKPRNF